MLDPQVSRFWQSTLLSGLMDAQGLTACWDAIAPTKREDSAHIDRRLARQAVQLKALTLWQAQQLLAGRSNGYKVDRYVLLDLIGQGGMGRVYLARDTRLNRRVALKILSPERVSNPRAIARFQREARVGAQLQHENLVRIYDFGESNGRYFLVMEFIEGKTIGTLISELGKIPPSTAVRLARQVALGLEHAHLKGLIHRDVNPYNVLVTRDGTAKLADLGLAIDLSEDDHVTREGATVGTFDYVAPEQARHSHSADIRSDIYSLGCTIYHMCIGHVPFPSPSLPEKLYSHQALEPTPLDQALPGFPKGLAAVVNRMMRKSPDERYATPMQVVKALEPYSEAPSVSAYREGGPQHLQISDPKLSPALPPSGQARAAVESHHGAEPIPALVKTVAVLNGSDAPPLAATETGSGANADLSTASPRSAVTDHEPSDPDFPLFVNLGPEPSLSDGLSRAKPRLAVYHSALAKYATASSGWQTPFMFWGLVALTATVIVIVGFLAFVNPFSGNLVETIVGSQLTADGKPKSKANTDSSRTIHKAEPAIIVRTEDENEQEFPAEKLLEAMQSAMGRGWVELRNREPLRLTSDQALDFISGRGRLVVRAAPGRKPVIEIQLKGLKPLLTTGSGIALELSGLTIKVSYPEQKAPSTPPALIMAAGSAKIDRCAFIITDGSHPKGSRAIVSNGGVLEINRSWFQGFDETIDITAMNRATARIRQTMIVPAFGPAQAQSQQPDWYGWGVKAQLGAGGGVDVTNPRTHLILERCTVEAAGLIDVTNSSASSPLEVEVNYCAVKAEALLACKRDTTPSAPIRWRGQGNQYDILGRVWIVLSASEGTPAFSSAATDLQSWLLFAPGDSKPVQEKLKFLTDPMSRMELAQPHDFKIQAPDTLQIRPGADPELVGPWSNP
jgi:eukaryotic-like serine/threonine-protein kinase